MPDTATSALHRTYRGPSAAGAPRLAGLPGVASEEVLPVEVLEVERYDTDDRRLTAAGIALAVHRDPGEAPHWRLDLPDGPVGERLRVPLAPNVAGSVRVPDELAALVRGAARDRAVRPAGRVRTVRTTTLLHDDAGRELARVVHDRVALATLGRSTEVEAWTEAALDVAAAAPELVDALAARIAEAGLRPGSPSAEAELERLLRPVRRARKRAGKRGSAGAVLVAHLGAQVDRLAAEELRVRRGGPDAVHQLRVASRRLRSALQAYRPLLDRERTEPIVEDLRAFGQDLAPARDTEVLAERITAGLAALPPELQMGPVQAQVSRHFARRGAETGAAVLEALDGRRYARLRASLDDLLERPPLTARAARPAAEELPALVGRTARRLERAVAVATDPDADDRARDEAVHAARKAGKRLRYAVEVVRPVVGKPADRFVSALKGFQSALGEHQDTVVARAALRELGAQAHHDGENGFAFGVLHGRDAALAASIEERLPALWASAWTKGHRRWLR